MGKFTDYIICQTISLTNFLKSTEPTVFKIPCFQRNYQWDIMDCQIYLDDIISTIENSTPHYLGHIVYYKDNAPGFKRNRYLILDGQQRMTTTLILLCALKNTLDIDSELYKEILYKFVSNRLEDINDDQKEAFRLKIHHNERDYNVFKEILKPHNQQNHVYLDKINSPIYRNYKFFYDKLNNDICETFSPETLIKSLDNIGITITEINYTARQVMPKIFERINATGISLNINELVKNFILMAIEFDKQEEFYKKYWLPMEDLLNDGNDDNDFEKFIIHYLTLKSGTRAKNADVYKKFTQYVTQELEKGVSAENILAELNLYSEYYSMFTCRRKTTDEYLDEYFIVLNDLDATMFTPILFKVFNLYYPNEIGKIRPVLSLLIDYYIKYRYTKPSSGGALQSVINNLINNIEDASYRNIKDLLSTIASDAKFYSNEEFIKFLSQERFYNEKLAKILFYRIENRMLVDDLSYLYKDMPTPQIINGKLKAATISNIAFTSRNISDLSWPEKKGVFQTSRYSLTKFLATFDEFTEASTKEYFEEITTAIRDLLEEPDDNVPVVESEEDIEDVEDTVDESKSEKLECKADEDLSDERNKEEVFPIKSKYLEKEVILRMDSVDRIVLIKGSYIIPKCEDNVISLKRNNHSKAYNHHTGKLEEDIIFSSIVDLLEFAYGKKMPHIKYLNSNPNVSVEDLFRLAQYVKPTLKTYDGHPDEFAFTASYEGEDFTLAQTRSEGFKFAKNPPVEARNWPLLYNKILELLYNIDSNKFISLYNNGFFNRDQKKTTKLVDKNPKFVQNPIRIGNTEYYTGILSGGNDCMRYVNKALEEYHMQDSILIVARKTENYVDKADEKQIKEICPQAKIVTVSRLKIPMTTKEIDLKNCKPVYITVNTRKIEASNWSLLFNKVAEYVLTYHRPKFERYVARQNRIPAKQRYVFNKFSGEQYLTRIGQSCYYSPNGSIPASSFFEEIQNLLCCINEIDKSKLEIERTVLK